VQKLILNKIFPNQDIEVQSFAYYCVKLRFVTYLSFECEVPGGLLILYSLNKNAQIEKVTNITSEKHTLLDLFVALGFDDRTFFRDGIEEHICYT